MDFLRAAIRFTQFGRGIIGARDLDDAIAQLIELMTERSRLAYETYTILSDAAANNPEAERLLKVGLRSDEEKAG